MREFFFCRVTYWPLLKIALRASKNELAHTRDENLFEIWGCFPERDYTRNTYLKVLQFLILQVKCFLQIPSEHPKFLFHIDDGPGGNLHCLPSPHHHESSHHGCFSELHHLLSLLPFALQSKQECMNTKYKVFLWLLCEKIMASCGFGMREREGWTYPGPKMERWKRLLQILTAGCYVDHQWRLCIPYFVAEK